MNKAALLCNGPSRVSYKPSPEYCYVLGCNVPWTDVTATVILDKPLIEMWHNDHDLIKVPVHFGHKAWDEACRLDLQFFKDRWISTVATEPTNHSSGHTACEILISLGYTQIDIYGCDAWFNGSADSFTRQFIDISSPNREMRQAATMSGWKLRWKQLMESNPNVEINFIR